MAKGGGSANKSYLYQETTALLNPTSFARFLDEKLRSLGTAACPPYHLAVVVGGTSAEFALKTAKYASARYLDSLPVHGDADGHAYRDLEMEAEIWKMTQEFGIGAQWRPRPAGHGQCARDHVEQPRRHAPLRPPGRAHGRRNAGAAGRARDGRGLRRGA
jgi:hypothetical protein